MIEVSGTGIGMAIPITKAELDALITSNGLVQGAMYAVSYIDIANWTNGVVGIFTAASDNSISNAGIGLFFNPDYNTSRVWTSGGVYAIDDKATWNGLVYNNISGANGGEPDTHPADWELLPYTSTSYIQEPCEIFYQYSTDFIYRRIDTNNNDVSDKTSSIKFFAWGNSTVNNNYLDGCTFNIYNVDWTSAEFSYNIGNKSSLVWTTTSGNPTITGNQFWDCELNFSIIGGNFQFNLLKSVTVSNSIADVIYQYNQIYSTTFTNSSIHTIQNSIITASNFNTCAEIFILSTTIYNVGFTSCQQFTFDTCSFDNCTFTNWNGVANSFLIKCVFERVTDVTYTIQTSGAEQIVAYSYIDREITIHAEFAFTGLAGRGAVGAYTLPTYALPQNAYLYSQQLYVSPASAITGLIGAVFSMGIETDAPTCNFNATPFATLNTNSRSTISTLLPVNNNRSTALRKIVANIAGNTITGGTMQVEAVYKVFKQ